MSNKQKPKILVVGGGFGGVKTARELAKYEQLHVTLVSNTTDFQYKPTLYRMATGGLRSQSSIPLKQLFPEQVELVQGTATQLDREARALTLSDGRKLGYDFIVLALGSVTNYFGIEGLAEYSYGVKSPEEVQRFKHHLHEQLTADHKPDLNYVIVGAGPTGIELAGALPAYLKFIMKNHGIKHRAAHVDLIEAAPRLLPRSPKKVSRMVRRRLRQLDIKLYLGQAVQGATADALMVGGKPLTSHTIVWTAGVSVNPFFKNNNFGLADHGKVAVNEYLESGKDVYVVGDDANTPYSGMAQTALHDGLFVAHDIVRRLNQQPRGPYKPKKPIYVIPAGPYWASVEWGRFIFSGWLGWALRQAADFIGFRDLEPWWRAGPQWLTEFGHEEDCPECAGTQT